MTRTTQSYPSLKRYEPAQSKSTKKSYSSLRRFAGLPPLRRVRSPVTGIRAHIRGPAMEGHHPQRRLPSASNTVIIVVASCSNLKLFSSRRLRLRPRSQALPHPPPPSQPPIAHRRAPRRHRLPAEPQNRRPPRRAPVRDRVHRHRPRAVASAPQQQQTRRYSPRWAITFWRLPRESRRGVVVDYSWQSADAAADHLLPSRIGVPRERPRIPAPRDPRPSGQSRART